MIPASLIAAFFSICAGAMIVMQAPLNARLGTMMGGPLWAAFFSFLVGLAGLALALLAMRRAPALENIALTAPWMWLGGLMGAAFVATTIFAVPRLGAWLMIALIIAGQMSFAILMDHYGFLVPQAHPASLLRLAGAVLVVAGAWLVCKG